MKIRSLKRSADQVRRHGILAFPLALIAGFCFGHLGITQARVAMALEAGQISSVERARDMVFTAGQFALVFSANPKGKPFTDTVSLPPRAPLRLQWMDGDIGVFATATRDGGKRLVWIEPGSVTNGAGWTLAKVLEGLDIKGTVTPDGLKAGGPFVMHGENMIACKDPQAVINLSAPDAESRYGRHTFLVLFAEFGCIDVPDGALVDIRSAGDVVAIVFPHIPVASALFVLRRNLFSDAGNPIAPFSPN